MTTIGKLATLVACVAVQIASLGVLGLLLSDAADLGLVYSETLAAAVIVEVLALARHGLIAYAWRWATVLLVTWIAIAAVYTGGVL